MGVREGVVAIPDVVAGVCEELLYTCIGVPCGSSVSAGGVPVGVFLLGNRSRAFQLGTLGDRGNVCLVVDVSC